MLIKVNAKVAPVNELKAAPGFRANSHLKKRPTT
jgi:hypothetical protein